MFTAMIQRLDRILAAVEKTVVVTLFSALVLSLAVNIVSRNFLDRSFQQVLELAPAMVLWLAMIGSTLALRQNRHIRLEILLRFCPEKFRYGARIAVTVFAMTVMGILGYASVDFVRNEVALFGSGGWIAVIFPVFFIIALFRFFTLLVSPAASPPGESV